MAILEYMKQTNVHAGIHHVIIFLTEYFQISFAQDSLCLHSNKNHHFLQTQRKENSESVALLSNPVPIIHISSPSHCTQLVYFVDNKAECRAI